MHDIIIIMSFYVIQYIVMQKNSKNNALYSSILLLFQLNWLTAEAGFNDNIIAMILCCTTNYSFPELQLFSSFISIHNHDYSQQQTKSRMQ
jgi:hypothetical protein